MRRILVVDDDVRIRGRVMYALAARGFDVYGASNGREALEHWEANRPDLVLTDINMPEMDGIELLRSVIGRSVVPVIAMSGGGLFPRDLLLKDARLLGACDVLRKPFTLGELHECVLAALPTD